MVLGSIVDGEGKWEEVEVDGVYFFGLGDGVVRRYDWVEEGENFVSVKFCFGGSLGL